MTQSLFSISIARDGSYIRFKNLSTYDNVANLESCRLTISRPGFDDAIANIKDLGYVTESLTELGVKLLPTDFSINQDTSGKFSDGYYLFTLEQKEAGQAESTATINEGFTSTVTELLNKKVLDMTKDSDPNTRSVRAKRYYVAKALVDSARADARVGLIDSYDSKIKHVCSMLTEV